MYSLTLCNCHQVSKPNIGETRPSQVRADVTINLNMRDIVKAEWEGVILAACNRLTSYGLFSNKYKLNVVNVFIVLYFSIKETRCGFSGHGSAVPERASEI